MKVFVTGATGFVGSAVTKELLEAGHKVLGLARSDESAKALLKVGAEVRRGSISDLESLKKAAAACDGVIHTAFNHDFSKFKENCETDRALIEAIGMELAGSDRLFIMTSGTALLPSGRIATEKDQPASDSNVPRIASEEAARKVAANGTRVANVRLPPSVHGEGDHGFVPLLIGLAREKGLAAYIGDGQNRWSSVHRLDAGRLYRLIFEKGLTGNFHGVAEEGVPFRQIAEVIGRNLKLEVVSKSKEDAATHFGWFAHFAGVDAYASSEQTRKMTGWAPTQNTLLADMERAKYFAT
jgi:nucleoside-diphosphate-sugar epimerase